MAAASTSSTSRRADPVPGAQPSQARSWRRPSVLPGFGLAFGITVTALSLIILIPLACLFARAATAGPADIWAIISSPRTLAALRLSFGAALVAAVVNAFFGLIIAWVLVRYRFPGRRLLDAAVDLPFALPTAVAGITLTAIYAPNGWLGALLEPFGIAVAYTPLGVIVALIFVGLPFVVRTVQPVLEDIDTDIEEAAALLGAGRLRTIFSVILPGVMPALMTGFALAFARAVGEYGSVIFIAGNIPGYSEIAPQLIVIRIEQYAMEKSGYAGASVVAALMLIISFALIMAINAIQSWSRKRLGHV